MDTSQSQLTTFSVSTTTAPGSVETVVIRTCDAVVPTGGNATVTASCIPVESTSYITHPGECTHIHLLLSSDLLAVLRMFRRHICSNGTSSCPGRLSSNEYRYSLGFILQCYLLAPSFAPCWYYYADHNTPSLHAPSCYCYDDFNIVVGVHTSTDHHHIHLDHNQQWFNIRWLLHVNINVHAYINGCSTNRSR